MKKEKKGMHLSSVAVSSYIYMFDKYKLAELCVKDNDLQVVIKKVAPPASPTLYDGKYKDIIYRNIPSIQQPSDIAKEQVNKVSTREEAEDKSNYKIISSPIIGTFYRRPSPDSVAFVSEGSVVNVDTTLCIIEAMKMMNEVKAQCAGTIVKILAQDGASLQKEQELFYIKPNM